MRVSTRFAIIVCERNFLKSVKLFAESTNGCFVVFDVVLQYAGNSSIINTVGTGSSLPIAILSAGEAVMKEG